MWLHCQGWFPEYLLFGGENTLKNLCGTEISVRCSEFRGSRFLEVVNTLIVRYFQSVTEALSTLENVFAFWSVRFWRFNCRTIKVAICKIFPSPPMYTLCEGGSPRTVCGVSELSLVHNTTLKSASPTQRTQHGIVNDFLHSSARIAKGKHQRCWN